MFFKKLRHKCISTMSRMKALSFRVTSTEKKWAQESPLEVKAQ